MSVSALSVVKEFLKLSKEDGIAVSNMNLQKLVFFAHGVCLAAFDRKLIKEDVKAWQFGPVIPRLYNRLKKYGAGTVVEIKTNSNDDVCDIDDNDFLESIKTVWKTFKNFSASQLSNISHAPGSPWDIVWNQQGKKFEAIPDDITKDYYKTKIRKSS